MGVIAVQALEPDLVLAQLDAVISDIPPQAAKTGALGTAEIVTALAARAATFDFPLVVDPVLYSTRGAPLLNNDAMDLIARELLPYARLVTPNLEEAARLTGRPTGAASQISDIGQMRDAAKALCDLGAQAALVKGGHLPDSEDAIDILYDGGAFHEFRGPRIRTVHTHGTGCTYSAAITAGLAAGRTLEAAVQEAKDFVTRAIATNPGLGRGTGPLNHWA
jgi:hydroxymethylpyrimidine/phosphomethylpyrimidine kinase